MESSVVEEVKLYVLNYVPLWVLRWPSEGETTTGERVGAYGVVNGNRDRVGDTWLDNVCDVTFKWKVATAMGGDLNSIYPL